MPEENEKIETPGGQEAAGPGTPDQPGSEGPESAAADAQPDTAQAPAVEPKLFRVFYQDRQHPAGEDGPKAYTSLGVGIDDVSAVVYPLQEQFKGTNFVFDAEPDDGSIPEAVAIPEVVAPQASDGKPAGKGKPKGAAAAGPGTPDQPPNGMKAKLRLFSPENAGKLVSGVGAKPVQFDADGFANEVSPEDLEFFPQVPGYEAVE